MTSDFDQCISTIQNASLQVSFRGIWEPYMVTSYMAVLQQQTGGQIQPVDHSCLTLVHLKLVSDQLAPRCIAAMLRDHRSSFRVSLFTEQHRSEVEQKSTVCNLPLWTNQQSYRLIVLMLLTAWSSFCSKWRLRSCTNITIKAVTQRAASQSESSIRSTRGPLVHLALRCLSVNCNGFLWPTRKKNF